LTRYTPLWLQAGSYPAGVDRRLINAIWPTAASKGAAVTVVAGTMTANVAPGSIAVPAANGTGSALCVWDANELVTFAPSPGSGLQRIDTVYILPRGNDLDGGSNTDFVFAVATGTPVASNPAYPPTPAGAFGFWAFVIPGAAASLDTAQSRDSRPGGLDTVKSGRGVTYPLAADVALTNGVTTGLVSATVVPGQQYLAGYVVTFTNPLASPAVSAWLQDANGFPVSNSGSVQIGTVWGELSASGLYLPGAGVTTVTLNAMANAASTTVRVANATGAHPATQLWLLPV
jgi:hypothetical protein